MIFNSFQFVIFFAIVYALYRSVPHRQQNWILLLASYYFYGSWDWRFLVLLLASTLIDYLCALYIDSRDDPGKRKRALIVSPGFNLSMLGFFKYFNFFASSKQHAGVAAHVRSTGRLRDSAHRAADWNFLLYLSHHFLHG